MVFPWLEAPICIPSAAAKGANFDPFKKAKKSNDAFFLLPRQVTFSRASPKCFFDRFFCLSSRNRKRTISVGEIGAGEEIMTGGGGGRQELPLTMTEIASGSRKGSLLFRPWRGEEAKLCFLKVSLLLRATRGEREKKTRRKYAKD